MELEAVRPGLVELAQEVWERIAGDSECNQSWAFVENGVFGDWASA
ncbi:MAG TPA: hypothetical protein VGS23_03880 [Thermoplasmata archaeon]|nr:hypothetical protein [Thermoplasmata archaeon]